jgi:hypothetical protein
VNFKLIFKGSIQLCLDYILNIQRIDELYDESINRRKNECGIQGVYKVMKKE